MTYKYEYETEEDRQGLIALYQGQGLILIEEHNITEGNFLVFSNEPQVTLNEKVKELELKVDNKDRENKAALFEIYSMLLGGE